jgi:hypothetical protein
MPKFRPLIASMEVKRLTPTPWGIIPDVGRSGIPLIIARRSDRARGESLQIPATRGRSLLSCMSQRLALNLQFEAAYQHAANLVRSGPGV